MQTQLSLMNCNANSNVWRIAMQTQLSLKNCSANSIDLKTIDAKFWQIIESFLQLATGEFEELQCKHNWVWRIAMQTAMFEELQCKPSWVWRIAVQTQLILKIIDAKFWQIRESFLQESLENCNANTCVWRIAIKTSLSLKN